MTFWELWRHQGPFGKLLFIYTATLFLIAVVKALRRLRKRDPHIWVEWSDWVRRAAVSAMMLCVSFALWHSGRILNGETILEATRPLSELIRHDEIIHLKFVSVAAGLVTLLFFIGWTGGTVANKNKTSAGGV